MRSCSAARRLRVAHEPVELHGSAKRPQRRPPPRHCAGFSWPLRGRSGSSECCRERGFLPVAVRDRRIFCAVYLRDVFHDHTDEVTALPEGFASWLHRRAVQAIADPERRWWGTQLT
jgi:hypothetical protein